MIKISFFYPYNPAAKFDFDYFIKEHCRMALERYGHVVKSLSVERGLTVGTPEATPPFIAACHLMCDSYELFTQAYAPHAEFLQNDVRNYTDIVPVVQVSAIEFHK
jgi:uncharacterized protein (TIGR02118 family)